MGAEDILQKFKDFDCRLVFSAESFCWPDVSLAVTNCYYQVYFIKDHFLSLSPSILESVWERDSCVLEVDNPVTVTTLPPSSLPVYLQCC